SRHRRGARSAPVRRRCRERRGSSHRDDRGGARPRRRRPNARPRRGLYRDELPAVRRDAPCPRSVRRRGTRRGGSALTEQRKRARVAIDGPAGAGKSTVARGLAERLGFVLLDTGALYRAVALAAQRRDVAWDDDAAVGELARTLAARGAISIAAGT